MWAGSGRPSTEPSPANPPFKRTTLGNWGATWPSTHPCDLRLPIARTAIINLMDRGYQVTEAPSATHHTLTRVINGWHSACYRHGNTHF